MVAQYITRLLDGTVCGGYEDQVSERDLGSVRSDERSREFLLFACKHAASQGSTFLSAETPLCFGTTST